MYYDFCYLVDVNECDSPTLNPCAQICTDTIGSFECSCNPGFTKDGHNCIGNVNRIGHIQVVRSMFLVCCKLLPDEYSQ